MNVTPSKLLLGVSLAAYAYISWDRLSGPKSASAAAAKGDGLTAGVVNRIVALKLDQDPFNSVPLNQTVLGPGGVAGPGSKLLGDLSLDGVMVTVAARDAAVINGKSVHEGEMMKAPGGATILIKKIGIGYCVIEGAGQTVLLKVTDPKDDQPAAGQQRPASASGGSNGGGGGATSATGNPYHSNGGGGGSAPARPAGTSATGNPYAKH